MRGSLQGVAIAVAAAAAIVAAGASFEGSRPKLHSADAIHPGFDEAIQLKNTIPHGRSLKVEDHLAPGKTTVIEFGYKECPGCRNYNSRLTVLDERRADLVVKTVEVHVGVDPSGRGSITAVYHLKGTPAFRIYGPDGALQAEGMPAMDRVNKMLSEAKL
ncbi:MAG: hypothetical protein HYU66_13605 [Armatimonadetes bacterium]|nr:hypothetical protein [Armatimonadota bacterium]